MQNSKLKEQTFDSKRIFKKSNDIKINEAIHKTRLRQKIRQSAISSIYKLTRQDETVVELDDHEHMLQINQESLKPILSLQNSSQCFSLPLEYGNYKLDYTLDGRNLLLIGQKGHAAILDWKKKNLICEIIQKDKFYSGIFAHTGFIAIAQERFAYIYDKSGLEIHVLDNIQEPRHLQYLSYHYLLCSLTNRGKLFYTDVSIGKTVSEI